MSCNDSKNIYNYLLKGSLICLLLILMIGTAAALAASLPEDMTEIAAPEELMTDRAANGIVRIVAGTADENGSFNKRSTANGLIVSKEGNTVYIITALHSVDYGSDGSIRVVIKNDSTVEATIEQPYRENDFCILSAENKFNDKDAVPLRASALDPDGDKLSEGDEVTVLAYPSYLGSSAEFSASDVAAYKGKVTKSASDNYGYIETDAAVPDSCDGGVLADKDGYIVGLVNTKPSGGGLTALDITDVDTALYKEGMAYRSKDKDLMYKELFDLCANIQEQYNKADKDTRNEILRCREEALEILKDSPYDRDLLSHALTKYKDVIAGGGLRMDTALKLVIVLAVIIIFLSVRLVTLIIWNDRHGAVPELAGSGSQPGRHAGGKSGETREIRPPSKKSGVAKNTPVTARLIMLRTGEMFTLGSGVTSLGKSSDSDISIHDNRKVSRHHALIESRDGAFRLRDQNSTNGSYVNGIPVDTGGVTLKPGDIIRLADEEIQFVQQ